MKNTITLGGGVSDGTEPGALNHKIMYSLRRVGDNAGQEGITSHAVEYHHWPEDNKLVSERPTIGYGMIVARGMTSYWYTTLVTEILEDTPNYVRFKTQNSEYIWKKLPKNMDPVKSCVTYLESGCAHVDGMLCNPSDCTGFVKLES